MIRESRERVEAGKTDAAAGEDVETMALEVSPTDVKDEEARDSVVACETVDRRSHEGRFERGCGRDDMAVVVKCEFHEIRPDEGLDDWGFGKMRPDVKQSVCVCEETTETS